MKNWHKPPVSRYSIITKNIVTYRCTDEISPALQNTYLLQDKTTSYLVPEGTSLFFIHTLVILHMDIPEADKKNKIPVTRAT